MTDETGLVPVGRVGRPHGLDGAFVVERASDDGRRWEVGASVLVDGAPATIELSRRVGGRRRAIRLDRQVERGAVLAVHVSELPTPEPDSYYAFQLEGMEVTEEGGRRLGLVQKVAPGVANDVLELDSGISLPMHEACIREIDLAAGTIVVAVGFAGDR